MMLIEDGRGTGSKAQVTNEGFLTTESTAIPFAFHINHDHQEAYSIIVEKTPTAAGNCFFYMKNNNEADMIGIEISLAVDTNTETIEMWGGLVGTPLGVTVNTPINVNLGSAKKADIDCYDGVDITGLFGGGKAFEFKIKPDESSKIYKTDLYVIIPKNATFALFAKNGNINILCVMTIVFHNTN